MKKLILLLITIATISFSSFGQAPGGFKYQAVVRDAGGVTLKNQAVGMRLSIQQGSIGGTAIYTETFAPTTNAYGLVNLEIGSGTTTDDFSTISWANGPYFMETAVDITGGTSYAVMGTSELLSVPYALHAKTAEKLTNDVCDLAIGDTYQGGIIFYLDASGCHGLVCVSTDQSSGIRWYNGANMDTYAYGSGVGSGKGNISAMQRWQGAGTYASSICYNILINGYQDWYLPSDYELNLMYLNIGQGNSLGLGNVGGFSSSRYWSSTEHSPSVVWYIDFSSGFNDGDLKSKLYRVRAVRAF